MGFEEGGRPGSAAGDHQVLVPALSGLDPVLLEDAGMDAARVGGGRGRDRRRPVALTPGPVARGWVALAEGDLAGAQQRAVAAVSASRATRRADALAESLELAAAVATDNQEARSILDEAEGIWRRAGATPAADRMVLLLGQLAGSDNTRRASAKRRPTGCERWVSRSVRMKPGQRRCGYGYWAGSRSWSAGNRYR